MFKSLLIYILCVCASQCFCRDETSCNGKFLNRYLCVCVSECIIYTLRFLSYLVRCMFVHACVCNVM